MSNEQYTHVARSITFIAPDVTVESDSSSIGVNSTMMEKKMHGDKTHIEIVDFHFTVQNESKDRHLICTGEYFCTTSNSTRPYSVYVCIVNYKTPVCNMNGHGRLGKLAAFNEVSNNEDNISVPTHQCCTCNIVHLMNFGPSVPSCITRVPDSILDKLDVNISISNALRCPDRQMITQYTMYDGCIW
jgi:hypothetical protein